MRRVFECLLVCCGVASSASGVAVAGDLMPPAGVVSPTMKALEEVEPRVIVNDLPGDATATHVISTSGSYYLTDDVAGEVGKDGISIRAQGVTLDLSGYRVVGVGGARSGIITAAGLFGFEPGVRVRNGFVEGWPQDGVKLRLGTCGVDGVTVVQCGENGIEVLNGAVTRCAARSNGNHGFDLTNATAAECVAVENGQDGFHVVECASISGSHSSGNQASGFSLDSEAVARGCVALGNAVYGFRLLSSSVAEDCAASLSGQSGFVMDEGCVARGCTSRQNSGHGFLAEPSGGGAGLPILIDSCSASRNSLNGVDSISGSVISGTTCASNTGSGFRFGGGCSISDCTAASNAVGFDSEGGGSTVRDCAAISNTGVGFESFNGNLLDSMASQNDVGILCAGGMVRGCTAAFNAQEGISDAGGTRIERNHAEFNGATGILVPPLVQSLVIGNDATGNSPNFSIGGGNSQGAVIDHTGGGGVLSSGEARENVER